MNNAICVDVDDLYWSLKEANKTSTNDSYFVDKEVSEVLDYFLSKNIKATLFIPGIFCKNSSHIIKRMSDEGHQIASHSDVHKAVKHHTQEEFYEDVTANKKFLEDITGQSVDIYKAPMWSLDKNTPWAYDVLLKAGFKIDHSAMPKFKNHLGYSAERIKPFKYEESLLVIPPTVFPISKSIAVPICGGFYNAYMPIRFQKNYFHSINNNLNLPYNYYFHPFEVFPHMENRKFFKKQGLYATLYAAHAGRHKKILDSLIQEFSFTTLTEAYKRFI
tara:strand:- start:4921 stop:5745 length:825 start_codon:yes stop_codon:yes gene_type:complete